MGYIVETREIPVREAYDVVVAGAGVAGLAAALAARRAGKRVLVLEKSTMLGGLATLGQINYFVPMCNGRGRQITKGMVDEFIALATRYGYDVTPESWKRGEPGPTADGSLPRRYDVHYSACMFALALTEMVQEEDIHLSFDTLASEPVMKGQHCEGLIVENKSGRQFYPAGMVVDCTGDADLAVMAGCPTRLGRDSDHLCQPMTLCFRVANVDMEKFRANRDKITPLYQKLQKEGKIRNPREDVLMFFHPVKNVVHFNTTRVIKLNPVDPFDLTKAEMEAREQMLEMFEMLKNNIAGFENADITMSGPQIGVRESRMIIGEHVLTVEELKACTRFPDAIAAGNYDVDIHSPDGAGTSHYYFKEGEYYTIPYRCLLPKGADNLLVAGRCISSTHEAQASYRIMPIVTTLGEAAGVAASVACKAGVSVKAVDVGRVQQVLRENGAFLGI